MFTEEHGVVEFVFGKSASSVITRQCQQIAYLSVYANWVKSTVEARCSSNIDKSRLHGATLHDQLRVVEDGHASENLTMLKLLVVFNEKYAYFSLETITFFKYVFFIL